MMRQENEWMDSKRVFRLLRTTTISESFYADSTPANITSSPRWSNRDPGPGPCCSHFRPFISLKKKSFTNSALNGIGFALKSPLRSFSFRLIRIVHFSLRSFSPANSSPPLLSIFFDVSRAEFATFPFFFLFLEIES